MQLGNVVFGLGIVCVAVLSGQTTSKGNTRPDRISSEKYGFSTVFPARWYVLPGELPVFFSFPAEKMLPQGELPPGGASINMLVREDTLAGADGDRLSPWADHEIRVNDGVAIERKYVTGPAVAKESQVLEVAFDQVGLGTPSQSLRFVIIFWQFRSKLFGAELCYIKGDPKGSQYERVLLDLVRSFRPI